MNFTSYLHREGNMVFAQRHNAAGTKAVLLSIEHDDTGKRLDIVQHPDGYITCRFNEPDDHGNDTYALGRWFVNGSLELHEPRPLKDSVRS